MAAAVICNMNDTNIKNLKEAVGLACDASYTPNILKGRDIILSMPKKWVLENIENVAAETLNLSDEWHFRRLLEVYETLDQDLVTKLVEFGLKSTNEEIVEAATDFKK